MAMRWRLYWLLVVLTMGLYLVMVLWSLPFIAQQAGGLVPFDMRPTGYDFADAQAFLGALTPEGRVFYAGIQHRLDTVYPALLALVLVFGGLGLARGRWRWGAYLLGLAAILGAAFDYKENSVVARLLTQDVQSLSGSDVEIAVWATLLKSGLTTVAMTLLLVLLFVRLIARIMGKRAA